MTLSKFKTALFNFGFRKSSHVVVLDATKAPEWALVPQAPKISLTAIKEHIEKGEDVELENYFPEISDKMERDLEVYWIDLRRQIRDHLHVDEAELQIDKVCTGMFGKEKRND